MNKSEAVIKTQTTVRKAIANGLTRDDLIEVIRHGNCDVYRNFEPIWDDVIRPIGAHNVDIVCANDLVGRDWPSTARKLMTIEGLRRLTAAVRDGWLA